MGHAHMSDEEHAERAEERLKEIPYHQLGPAGRILADNPLPPTPEQRRERFRQVEGGGSGRTTETQLPLMGSVKDGG